MSERSRVKMGGRFSNRKVDTSKEKYERAVDEYKVLLGDKTHPDNRTAAHKKNTLSIFNRLLTAADDMDQEEPGAGVFGLIVLALRANLALKDSNIELEVKVRELEKRMKRLEKR